MKITAVQRFMNHTVDWSLMLLDGISYCFLCFTVSSSYSIPISRWMLDIWRRNVAPVIYAYPIGALNFAASELDNKRLFYRLDLIKEFTRPRYWRPDHECKACFVCKHPFNTTTHRLHHWYVLRSVFVLHFMSA